jgi:hypothetical protein
MQEQLMNQLVQQLQERAHLDPEKAQQVAQVASDFAQQHLPELIQSFGGEGGAQGALGKMGGMFGNR